jgi:alanine-synthesizing transaminase
MEYVPEYGVYSRRLPWSSPLNSYSSRITELRQSGAALLDLTSSNPTACSFRYPHERIASAFRNISNFEYQPDPLGEPAAREVVRAYYSARNLEVDCDRILLTASTSEAYGQLFKLLCDPGDEILIPLPSYPLFEYLASLESVRTVPYWLRYDGSWHIDFHALESRVGERTKGIVVVNPNNPTASFLKQEETDRLFDIAKRRGLALIADEVFFDYGLGERDGRTTTFVHRDDALSFSLNGLSKAAGMPQMKLGWMVINGPPAVRKIARERLGLILDTYLSVNTPVQRALPELMEIGMEIQQQIQWRIRDNYRRIEEKLAGSSAHPLHTEGGWCSIVRLPRTRSEEAWLETLLTEYELVVQPGYFFDMPGEPYVVLSLLTSPEVFDVGLERLALAAQMDH